MFRILIILLLLLGNFTFSQAQTLKAYEKAADEAFEKKDYYTALEHYSTILEADDDRTRVWYKYGETARLFNAYTAAEQAYQKVDSSEQRNNYPLLIYWMGVIKKHLGKYEEARAYLQKYVSATSTSATPYTELARKEIADCEWAIEIVKNPDDEMEVKRLGDNINTAYSEFGALEKDDTLYYSSFRFVKEEEEEELSVPERPISQLMTSVGESRGRKFSGKFNEQQAHTAHTTFSRNGSRIIYTICNYINDTEIRCAIYYRDKAENNKWGNPVKLPEQINPTGYTSTQPHIVLDPETGQEALYFVSDRPEGKGKMDVWVSRITEEGAFSGPQNLSDVNTAENEITPFFHLPTNTLYFSSTGYQNLGGYDVYKSVKTAEGWGEVTHLPPPLNSSYNDIYYTLNETSTKGYFSSNRKGSAFLDDKSETCCNDIYSLFFNEIELDLLASFFDAKDQEPLKGVLVSLVEVGPNKEERKLDRDSNEYGFMLEREKNYMLITSLENYLPDTIEISTKGIKTSQTIQKKINLKQKPPEQLPPMYLKLFTLDSEEKKAVDGVTIKLIDPVENTEKVLKNEEGNEFTFEIVREKPYKIVGFKEGYKPDTIQVTPGDYKLAFTYTRELMLDPIPVTLATLDGYLPLPLFFDNDQPEPQSWKTTTEKTYEKTYKDYIKRKVEFKENYTEGLSEEDRIIAEQEIETFFNEEVSGGYEGLKVFFEQLIRFLEEGSSTEILIKGFSSPRSSSKYNKRLGNRRVSSIVNYFNTYKKGIFKKYLDSGQLVVSEISFGEEKAASTISDDMRDAKGSVYSVNASRERRVEIIEIKNK